VDRSLYYRVIAGPYPCAVSDGPLLLGRVAADLKMPQREIEGLITKLRGVQTVADFGNISIHIEREMNLDVYKRA